MFVISRFGDVLLAHTSNDQLGWFRPLSNIGTHSTLSGIIPLVGGGRHDSFGTAQAPLDLTPIIRRGIVQAATPTALRSYLLSLWALRGTRRKLYRTVSATGEVEWCWARLIEVAAPREERTITHINDVTLTFQPLTGWYGEVHGGPWFLDSGESFDDALYLDAASITATITSSGQMFSVTNGGNRDVTNPVILVEWGSGNLTSFTISSITASPDDWGIGLAGSTFSLDFEFDCGARSVVLAGSFTGLYDFFSYNGNHAIEEWARLVPGANLLTVTFTGTASELDVTLSFADGWQ